MRKMIVILKIVVCIKIYLNKQKKQRQIIMPQSYCLSNYFFSSYDKGNVKITYPMGEEKETFYLKWT